MSTWFCSFISTTWCIPPIFTVGESLTPDSEIKRKGRKMVPTISVIQCPVISWHFVTNIKQSYKPGFNKFLCQSPQKLPTSWHACRIVDGWRWLSLGTWVNVKHSYGRLLVSQSFLDTSFAILVLESVGTDGQEQDLLLIHRYSMVLKLL